MRCLICNANFSDDVLKSYYQYYHFISENNYFFMELFSPGNISRKCDECKLEFKNCRLKNNHNFVFYYNQTGGSRNQQLSINVLRCGLKIYYSINFYQ